MVDVQRGHSQALLLAIRHYENRKIVSRYTDFIAIAINVLVNLIIGFLVVKETKGLKAWRNK